MSNTFNAATSSVYRQGASGQTQSVVSSRFKIYSPIVNVGAFYKMGVTSSFAVSESKNIEQVRGLGYGDQVAELVPGVTEPMSLTITRTCLYLSNIMQMMGYKAGASGLVRSLKHHKWPFDIRTEIVFSELSSEDPEGDTDIAHVPPEGGLNNLGASTLYCVTTLYVGCWMSNYSSSYQISTAVVNEDCTVMVTDVIDNSGSVYGEFIDSGNTKNDVTGRSVLYSENNIDQ